VAGINSYKEASIISSIYTTKNIKSIECEWEWNATREAGGPSGLYVYIAGEELQLFTTPSEIQSGSRTDTWANEGGYVGNVRLRTHTATTSNSTGYSRIIKVKVCYDD